MEAQYLYSNYRMQQAFRDWFDSANFDNVYALTLNLDRYDVDKIKMQCIKKRTQIYSICAS